ncbi:AbiV family abortive infection protein [Arthrobacter sp. efr-133-TYG-118]|uniref:AbiV family abortive infection protein n=1 Tax=Arthrobacter sp. efr-133-TYG-118 TaxID=3040279 RepID=UPI002550B4A8|nr:AbiV family abortive infection protein [Arthrobacter sp. efr-133-TYG-118]
MARPLRLPADLSPSQVISLQDALLANADKLLRAALTMLENDNVALARSLAILGMEESGKAIALHERRVHMAYAPEGEPFVDERLQKLWGLHGRKLEIVHGFLIREDYWFGVEAGDPEENARVLGTIEAWKLDHNVLKQRGFYVDVTPAGEPATPAEVADGDSVRDVIGYVHQIGWQLRLGEHIEGRARLEREREIPPATEAEIESMRSMMKRVEPAIVERILSSMRQGTEGEGLNNAAYAFTLPESPFENIGRPGYEAQDRELQVIAEETSSTASEAPTGTTD